MNTVQEQLQLPDTSSSSDISTYWAAKPAFDPQSVLLRPLFFINGDKTKYVSVGFYPARDYQPLVEFCVIRWGGSKSIILTDELVYTLAECLPKMLDSMCKGRGDNLVIRRETVTFG